MARNDPQAPHPPSNTTAPPPSEAPPEAWNLTRDFLLPLAFIAVWLVLSRWVLPIAGFPSCTTGACATAPPPPSP